MYVCMYVCMYIYIISNIYIQTYDISVRAAAGG